MRVKRKNIIHWRENLEPTEKVLGLEPKRGTEILEAGALVIIDADFIYDENDPKIQYTDSKYLYNEFEERYQSEKRKLENQKGNSELEIITKSSKKL